MKRVSMVLMFLFITVIVAACGGGKEQVDSSAGDAEGNELVIEHELGETPVQKNPEKVVVFDFGMLDSLDKLGVEVAAVPQANIPSYLSKYEDSKYVNAGSLKEPDFEAISEIQPDLIIISGRQQDLYDELSKIGPTIYMGVDTSRYMESYTENANTLAEIFDKQAEVDAELENVNEAIEQLHTKATETGNMALIIFANEVNVSDYGPAS